MTATLCDAHDRMLNALENELLRRRATTKGARDLLDTMEAEPDRAIRVIEQGLHRLTGSTDGADEVLDHIEHARHGEPFSRRRVS